MAEYKDKVLELARKHLKEFKIKDNEVIPKYCPFCSGGQNSDQETFAVGLHNGAWNCKRGSCPGPDGKKREGSFKELANFFGESAFDFANMAKMKGMQKKKTYARPNEDDFGPMTDEILSYFATRHISRQTLDDWKIKADKSGNIVFPFYRDGKLIYIKYRKPKNWKKIEEDFEKKKAEYDKLPEAKKKETAAPKKPSKEWRMENTEPILFGMDMVSFNKPLVITEGEMDALSVYEAGYSNVVSVPSGANDFTWTESCYDWLDKFQQIILFGDMDPPGMQMISTLMAKLGEDRCMVPEQYPECVFKGQDLNRICKDANEILICYGKEVLKDLVESCEPAPIKGLLDVAAIPFIDVTQRPRIMTQYQQLDNMIGGLGEAGITIISGKRGEGKSTIGNSFLLNAVQQGFNTCVYSGELSANTFKDWLYLTATESQYIGYRTDPRSGKNICVIDETIQERISEWLSGKVLLFDNAQVFETDQQTAVLKCFEMAARKYNCKLFLIDNLMSLLTTGDEENRAQAKFMATVKAFASKYKVHVLCVCHPRKTKQGETFTNDDVSGSSVLTNLADNVLSIERPNIRVKCCSFMQ